MGYAFTLADVGCPVDWPQVFTLRPGQASMTLDFIGGGRDRRTALLNPSTDGRARPFSHRERGLSVRGSVLGAGQESIVLDLDQVTYAGVDLCTPGRYPLRQRR